MDEDDECVCGHVRAEHQLGSDFFHECAVDGCNCGDFEWRDAAVYDEDEAP